METQIYYSVNSGLMFVYKDTKVCVDFFFEEIYGFSAFPDLLKGMAISGVGMMCDLSVAVFTHMHPDHYDSNFVKIIKSKNPNIKIFTPEDNELQFCIGESEIIAFKTIHDGKIFEEEPHYSYLLRNNNEQFFIAGDACFNKNDVEAISKMGSIDAGFFNPYQLRSENVYKIIENSSMKKVFINHLPYEEDDAFFCHNLSKQSLEYYPDYLPKPEYIKPMSWIKF